MSNTEIIIYGLIFLWIVVVITHAFSRANYTRPLQIVSYKYIDQTKNMATFQDEFIIGEQYAPPMPHDVLIKRELLKSKDRIFSQLPENCFEIQVDDSPWKREKSYLVKIKIIVNNG